MNTEPLLSPSRLRPARSFSGTLIAATPSEANERTGGILTINVDRTKHSGETCRATLSVTEAANILGISRTTAYECVRTGELPSLRLRGRIVVPAVALESLIAATQR